MHSYFGISLAPTVSVRTVQIITTSPPTILQPITASPTHSGTSGTVITAIVLVVFVVIAFGMVMLIAVVLFRRLVCRMHLPEYVI